ncbi:hypothetical protein TYRP_019906 [Tyrophagus putrescentiae]|nr:hypothetical protein TYRP_019906 [Tyrophagus putrescentiae]
MSLGDSSSQLCPLVPSSVIPYQQQQLIDTNNNNNTENGLSYTEVAPAAVSYQQLQQQQTSGAIMTPTFYTLPSSAPATVPGIVPNYQHPNFQPPYQPFPPPPAGIPYYPNPYYPTPYQPGYPSPYFPASYYQPPPPPPQLPMQQPPTQPVQLTINNYGVINMQR